MVENMFFLDSEHVGMRECSLSPPPPPPPPKRNCLFMLYVWFVKIILLGAAFFVAANK